MPTVRDLAYGLLRERGMTTIFGNPGSNELPFLAGMPADFQYVLGLHEGAVLAMADGYAQVTGKPTLVNLHAAAGMGNAMGALTNAAQSHSPLVVTAGQQVRATIGQDVMLASADAASLPRPLVRWSGEPSCAEDVPRALNEAILQASSSPGGPVSLSIPYDDWGHEAPAGGDLLLTRSSVSATTPDSTILDSVGGALRSAARPALVVGHEMDTDQGFATATELAERLGADVWLAPSPSRCAFPTRHPLFRGVLPAGIADVAAAFEEHDLVVVLGAPVFRYHQYVPGDYLPTGTRLVQITADPAAAARAPIGEAVVADPPATATALLERVPAVNRTKSVPNLPSTPHQPTGRVNPAALFAAVRDAAGEDAVYVVESTSTTEAFWEQMDLRRPGSYLFPAAGGLGFGLPAALGAQLAHDELGSGRRVVGLIGDGSANYGITALWTAATLRIPAVIVILNNGTYGALRGFADLLGTGETPGLDIPGIDFGALARGYGVQSAEAGTIDQFHTAFTKALASSAPTLIEVRTAHPSHERHHRKDTK